jgi:starch phosphorylase
MSATDLAKEVPRVVIFAGKSAPGYYLAKLIIKLINNVARVVNGDAVIGDKLKLVFIPNYNVSLAEIMIPASDISQHISTAGTEASGTSNMKFVLNGGLIIGTVDGANIEIREEIGEENIWLFGALAHEVDDIRHEQLLHRTPTNPHLEPVLHAIRSNTFSDSNLFEPLISTLTTGHDFYIVNHDFGEYIETNKLVDKCYSDTCAWAKKSICAAAGMGNFSSDRSVMEYAEKIWKCKPCVVPEDASTLYG